MAGEGSGRLSELAELLGLQRRHEASSSWWVEAACEGYPLTTFHGEKGSAVATITHDRAKRICARCPVRRDCLDEALVTETPVFRSETGKWDHRLPAGIWGGQSPDERHDFDHLNPCRKIELRVGKCPGCRPIAGRVSMLEERFKAEAHLSRFLTRSELAAGIA